MSKATTVRLLGHGENLGFKRDGADIAIELPQFVPGTAPGKYLWTLAISDIE